MYLATTMGHLHTPTPEPTTFFFLAFVGDTRNSRCDLGERKHIRTFIPVGEFQLRYLIEFREVENILPGQMGEWWVPEIPITSRVCKDCDLAESPRRLLSSFHD